GGSDLVALERLLDLTERLEHPDVGTEFRRTRRDAAHDAEDLRIELSAVGLATDRNRCGELDRRGDPAIELAHPLVVALEQLEEAGLRAGGALHSTAWQRGDPMIEVGQVEDEVLHPERRTLADRRRLRRLQMRVAQSRLGAPLASERRECAQHPV